MINLLLYLIISIGWTIPFFLIKELTNYFSQYEIMIISHLAWHVLMILCIIYLLIFKKSSTKIFINKLKNLPNKYLLFITLITIIGFISQFTYITLFKTQDVSKVLPIVRGLSNIFIILLACTVFKENITFLKIIGIILIGIGIYLIN